MNIIRTYFVILTLAFISAPLQAGTYNGFDDLELSLSTASELTISLDNGGVITFTNLAENDVIDTSSAYSIVSDPSRSFSCHINYEGNNYNIGDNITAPLRDPSNAATGVNLNLTFVSCATGSNSMALAGTISLALDSGTTYHVDTQYISVSYTPGTIIAYT